MTTTSGTDQISMFRLLALRAALRLEVIGMHRSRRPSVFQIVKQEFGFKGNKTEVLRDLDAYIRQRMD